MVRMNSHLCLFMTVAFLLIVYIFKEFLNLFASNDTSEKNVVQILESDSFSLIIYLSTETEYFDRKE